MALKYYNEVTDYYSGQTNLAATLYKDDEPIAAVIYVIYDNELTISDIFVKPEYRRKGYGSRLIKYIKQENPEATYKPSMQTDLGAKFVHKDISLDESKNPLSILKSMSGNEFKEKLKNNDYLFTIYSKNIDKFKKEFQAHEKAYDVSPDIYPTNNNIIIAKYGKIKHISYSIYFFISYNLPHKVKVKKDIDINDKTYKSFNDKIAKSYEELNDIVTIETLILEDQLEYYLTTDGTEPFEI